MTHVAEVAARAVARHPDVKLLTNGLPFNWMLNDDDLLALGLVTRRTETVVGMVTTVRAGMATNVAMTEAWAMGACNLGGTDRAPRTGRDAATVRVCPAMAAWAAANTAPKPAAALAAAA